MWQLPNGTTAAVQFDAVAYRTCNAFQSATGSDVTAFTQNHAQSDKGPDLGRSNLLLPLMSLCQHPGADAAAMFHQRPDCQLRRRNRTNIVFRFGGTVLLKLICLFTTSPLGAVNVSRSGCFLRALGPSSWCPETGCGGHTHRNRSG